MAHEIAHNLNIDHDFLDINATDNRYSRNGTLCSGSGGVMDYYNDIAK